MLHALHHCEHLLIVRTVGGLIVSCGLIPPLLLDFGASPVRAVL